MIPQTRNEMRSNLGYKKAKEKSVEDPTKVYIVRGDPKNGLRLIWLNKI